MPRAVSPGFHARVKQVVRRIPSGRVTTYGAVAAALGSPRVARHVGWALAALGEDDLHGDDPVPWQRVINASGRISSRGDTGRAELQRALLEAEGVPFANDRVDLRAWGWLPTPDPAHADGAPDPDDG